MKMLVRAPKYDDPLVELYCGDAREVLASLPAESVQCCITSPPYLGLRNYKIPPVIWGDGWQGSLGLEPSPELYVQHIVEVFQAVKRVLRKDGTLWVNMGDSYAHGEPGGGSVFDNGRNDGRQFYKSDKPRGREKQASLAPGLKPLDLCGIPWRVALALQADGWFLRSDIIWSKSNPMPESIHGSYFTRHRVTIEEYERLQSLRIAKGSNQDGASDLSRMPETKIPDSQEAIPAESEGDCNSTGKGRTPRCQGEKASLQSVATRTSKQTQIRENTEGQRDSKETVARSSCPEARSGGDINGNRMVGYTETAQISLPLLQEEKLQIDDRPCDSPEQGRAQFGGEYSPCMPQMQFKEAGQNRASLLVDCPGCPVCLPNDGLVLRRGSWRPTTAHEYVFMLAKSAEYFSDGFAVREASTCPLVGGPQRDTRELYGMGGGNTGLNLAKERARAEGGFSGRNKCTIWEITTQPYAGAHFATFPEKLVEPCLLAGTSEKGACPKCGKAWVRVVEKQANKFNVRIRDAKAGKASPEEGYKASQEEIDNYLGGDRASGSEGWAETLGWRAACACGEAEAVPCIVLDPFAGSGTVGVVARQWGRKAILVELSEKYCQLAIKRLTGTQPAITL